MSSNFDRQATTQQLLQQQLQQHFIDFKLLYRLTVNIHFPFHSLINLICSTPRVEAKTTHVRKKYNIPSSAMSKEESYDVEAIPVEAPEPTLLSSKKKTSTNEVDGTTTKTVTKKFSDGTEEVKVTTISDLAGSKTISTTTKFPDGTEETEETTKKLKKKNKEDVSAIDIEEALPESSPPPSSPPNGELVKVAPGDGVVGTAVPVGTVKQHQHGHHTTTSGGCCCCCGPSPDGKPANCMATSSLICGIISIFIFGVILGSLAIIFGSVALCQIGSEKTKWNPNARCLAITGMVCGIVGFVWWLILLILYV